MTNTKLEWLIGNNPGASEDATAPSLKVPGGLWSVGGDGYAMLYVEGNESLNRYLVPSGSAEAARALCEETEASL